MRNIILILALLTLAACGSEDSSEDHLDRAKKYIQASNSEAAIIELQNTLKLNGASAEARWLLGKVYLELGDILAAEKELQHAQGLGWTDDDIRPAMARTLLAQGKFPEVLALESRDLNPAAAALLLSSQTMAALSEKQTDRARELVALALHKEPQLLAAKLAEVSIAVQQGDADGALVKIEAILAGAPETGEAWWLQGQALLQQGKLEDARAAFDQSIAHSTIGIADRIARALVNLQLKDYAAAQADATELLKRYPKNAAANYLQGVLDFHHKEYRNAIRALTLAEPAAQQFPLALYYLSLSYLIEQDLVLAERFGSQYVVLQPDDGRGRRLLATILVLQNKAKAAQDMLQPALEQNSEDVAALNIMANALLLDDQADIGMVLYARIAQLQADWRFVPLRMETELLTSTSAEETSQLTAPTQDSAANFPQTDILSILNHLAKKDFAHAIERAKHFQIKDFESLAPYRVLGRVYFAAGQFSQAKDAFEQALKRKPADPAANLSLAEMAIAAGDPGTARRHYKTILDGHPDDLTTLLQLSALEAKEENKSAMVVRLNQAIQAHPAVLEPRLRLAGYYMTSGSADKVEPLFAKLTPLQRRSPRVLEFTAQAHYLLAMGASEAGDQQKAKQELLEAIQRDPKHPLALLGLARIAKGAGDQRLFEHYLATLVELAPDAPDVLRLRALLAQSQDNDVEALVFLGRAFKSAPSTQTVLELTTLQKTAGRKEAARTTLQQWIKDHPKDVDARLFLANDLTLENDSAGAQAQYLAVLLQAPGSITALNNLAWNLRLENPQQALEYIRRASNLVPDQPDLLDTLAVVESLNGDHKSAQITIQRALAARPGDLSMRYHEAMIAAARGDNAQAIAALEDLVKKEADQFPERVDAAALLQKLKG